MAIYPFAFFWNWLYGERYAVCTAFFQNQTEQNLNLGRVLIRSGSGRTDAQGKFKIEIDSGDAAAQFGARNFRYTVEAEVKDSSRRVVTGSGSVIAAVQPFSVSVYTPWGFAKTGERQTVEVKACTPDGQPVRGRGVLRIFRRALNKDGVPARTGEALRTIRFTPGGAEMPEFLLNEEGVYELCAEVVAENGTAVSESVPFFVVGKTQGKTLFGEYPVSISTDKPTYQPGETAEILVACRKPGQTVYFIARSEREAKIECVTLEGHAKLFRVPVNKDDQPNFFVDVMSYQDGKMLTLRKEVVVPPEKKLLNVAIQPAAEKVKPGTELPLRISVTGLDGKPVSGNVTVAVYDKSLEAVSGSPIRQIGSFFWGWRRHGFMYFMHNFGISLPLYFDGKPMHRNVERSFSIPFGSDGESSRRYRRERHFVMKAVGAARAWTPMPEAAAPAAAAMNMLQDAQPSSSPSPVLRTDFRDRAFWAGNLRLPPDGETTISIPVPDNLTTWVVRGWSLTPDTRVGEARSEIVVSKDLIARMTLPRFMVQGDTVN
ncbi:MAG: hypothetical protein J6S73_06340, partial [Lentisphaeria bacterium]|nr:hypothetical protein [Lentisphaeria bacterium]